MRNVRLCACVEAWRQWISVVLGEGVASFLKAGLGDRASQHQPPGLALIIKSHMAKADILYVYVRSARWERSRYYMSK